jgi:hypothetical protein
MAACRGCRQPIRWETTRNGKGIALDPEPRPDGNVVMRGPEGLPKIAHVLRDGEETFEGETRFRTHWESCPKAEDFRKKKAGS